MRRRKSVEPRFFVGIAAVAVLCILSAVYSGVTGNPSPVSRAAGAVIRPVQRLASGIGGVFGRGIGYFTEFDELKAENEELKKQLRENEQLVRDAQLAIEENNRFRAQAGQPERQRNLTTVNAEVISRNPGDTAVTLTLDKGTAHGVAKGDLVTTIDGMVGYVSEAGSNTCEVTTVTDVDMQCGALITRTRGDTVETSGRGGAFPKGIMIGTVESVQPEETGISYYAVLRPFVNVSNVSSVSIITDFTDTTE